MGHNHEESALARDLLALEQQKLNRRKVFAWMGAATALPILGGVFKASSVKAAAACAVIPTETAGPFPGDGSNGKNVLNLSGVVRSDITKSVGEATGIAEGVPLRVELSLINSAGSCEALEGYAIYIWQCDAAGNYSMYSTATKDENYLRGVQATDADGLAVFESVFPGCYPGRWPHIHFEVYKTVEAATTYKSKVATSQLALTPASCKLAFAAKGYESSVTNLARISLATDGVFRDGVSLQLATVTGSVEDGFVAKLTVAIKA